MGSDRRIYKRPLQVQMVILGIDSCGSQKSIFHCHTYNEVGNMRADRVEKKGTERSRQGVQKRRRGHGWIGRDVNKYTNKGNGRLCSYGQA